MDFEFNMVEDTFQPMKHCEHCWCMIVWVEAGDYTSKINKHLKCCNCGTKKKWIE